MKRREIKIGQKLVQIATDNIIPDPDQPRKTFNPEVINSLAQSLDYYGLVTALTVRPIGEGRHMIIEGEERWRAARQAGLEQLLCVSEDIIDDDAHLMQLIASVRHDEIPESELAIGIAKYLDSHPDTTQAELANCLGWNKSDVSIFYRIAKLPVELFNRLQSGDLEFKEVRELVRIKSGKRQMEVAQPFIDGTLTSEHISKVVTVAKEKPKKPVSEIIAEVVPSKKVEGETEVEVESGAEAQAKPESEGKAEVEGKAETKATVEEKAEVTLQDEVEATVQNINKSMKDLFDELTKLEGKDIPGDDWNETQVYVENMVIRLLWFLNDRDPEAVDKLLIEWRESQQGPCEST